MTQTVSEKHILIICIDNRIVKGKVDLQRRQSKFKNIIIPSLSLIDLV